MPAEAGDELMLKLHIVQLRLLIQLENGLQIFDLPSRVRFF